VSITPGVNVGTSCSTGASSWGVGVTAFPIIPHPSRIDIVSNSQLSLYRFDLFMAFTSIFIIIGLLVIPLTKYHLIWFPATMNTRTQRINELEEEIQALKAQWPAHSVKAWMLQQLEDLEEELAPLRRKASQETRNDATSNDHETH